MLIDLCPKCSCSFRLNLSDCSFVTVEAVMQFVYTGSVSVLGIYGLEDINKFLLTGQKLGLDPTKLGLFLAVLVSYADLRYWCDWICH